MKINNLTLLLGGTFFLIALFLRYNFSNSEKDYNKL